MTDIPSYRHCEPRPLDTKTVEALPKGRKAGETNKYGGDFSFAQRRASPLSLKIRERAALGQILGRCKAVCRGHGDAVNGVAGRGRVEVVCAWCAGR